jgi:hypothetical protein
MKQTKWTLFVATLAMIAATMTYLAKIHGIQRLDSPGVRVGAVPLYSATGTIIANQSVLLPETVHGVKSTAEPITDAELSGLPKDTTFGRRLYSVGEQFAPLVTAVLMGTDRSSIHDPHYCLTGAGWTIDQTEHVILRMKQPYLYDLPVIKLTTSRVVADENQHSMIVRGFYVYWFVSGDKITADQGARLWSIARKMVEKGELERWAYISYFVPCSPGAEKATFDRLKQFIQESAPAFQLVAGQPAEGSPPVATLR